MTDTNKLTIEIPALKLLIFISKLKAVEKTLGNLYSITKLLNHDWILDEMAKQLSEEEINSVLVAFKLEMSNIKTLKKD